MKTKLLCLLLCLTVLLSVGIPAAHASHVCTVAEVENLCDGIVGYKDGQNAQHFINNGLSAGAGTTAEFYIIALSQQGYYDFSSYEKALLKYLKNNEVYSATSREKYALALIASGSNNGYISRTADEAIGGQGLMSLVFGLHILNNGYKSKLYSVSGLINAILNCQLSDGGWAVIGSRGDVDVTAMTLQALAPYYHSDSGVNAAIDRALTLLSQKQQANGGFIGMGVENCESAAQVLTALSDLHIDQNSDSRFIKNGCTVMDAVLSYRSADGSFSHTGGGFNETATVQAFYALTAYRRCLRGQGPLYVLDRRSPLTVEPAEKPTEKAKQPTEQQSKSKPDNGSKNSTKKNKTQNKTNTNNAPQAVSTEQSGNQQNRQNRQNVVQPQNQPHTEATERKEKKKTAATEKATATTAPTEPTAAQPTENGAGLFQPTATAAASEAATVNEAAPAAKGSYKPYAIGAILLAAIIAAIILYLLKKRNKKHYIAVAVLAALGVLFILLTNFESAESYRTVENKTDTVGTVTLSVRCDTLTDSEKPSHIPDDRIILGETEFAIEDGDTVYDILLEASKRYDFSIDNRGAAGNAYIAGIAYLYEFDFGDLSGWMYKLNGVFPDVGCQSCTLHDSDKIEWLYTKNIGKDLD